MLKIKILMWYLTLDALKAYDLVGWPFMFEMQYIATQPQELPRTITIQGGTRETLSFPLSLPCTLTGHFIGTPVQLLVGNF